MRRLVLLALSIALVWTPGAGAWTWPADGSVLQGFSFGGNPYGAGQHRGIDVADPSGAAIAAPAGGTVTFAGSVPDGGNSVTIRTDDGYSVTLVHLGSVGVLKGAVVAEGSAVGDVGPSGTPEFDQPYVHLGIRVASDPQGYVDPLGFLPPRPVVEPKSAPPATASTAGPAAGSPPVTVPAGAAATEPAAQAAQDFGPATAATQPSAGAAPIADAAAAATSEAAPTQAGSMTDGSGGASDHTDASTSSVVSTEAPNVTASPAADGPGAGASAGGDASAAPAAVLAPPSVPAAGDAAPSQEAAKDPGSTAEQPIANVPTAQDLGVPSTVSQLPVRPAESGKPTAAPATTPPFGSTQAPSVSSPSTAAPSAKPATAYDEDPTAYLPNEELPADTPLSSEPAAAPAAAPVSLADSNAPTATDTPAVPAAPAPADAVPAAPADAEPAAAAAEAHSVEPATHGFAQLRDAAEASRWMSVGRQAGSIGARFARVRARLVPVRRVRVTTSRQTGAPRSSTTISTRARHPAGGGSPTRALLQVEGRRSEATAWPRSHASHAGRLPGHGLPILVLLLPVALVAVLRRRRPPACPDLPALQEPLPIIDGDALLRDNPDLLRELDPAHRSRLHDDCGGHLGAASPAARGRDVLPDRRRRACVEGLPRRARAGNRPARVRRPDRRRLERAA